MNDRSSNHGLTSDKLILPSMLDFEIQFLEMTAVRLLDDDTEWFNIPSVIRQVLRLVVKENTVSSALIGELRHDVCETRSSVADWIKFTRLVESDARERLSKLEADVDLRHSLLQESSLSTARQQQLLRQTIEAQKEDFMACQREATAKLALMSTELEKKLLVVKEDLEENCRVSVASCVAQSKKLNEDHCEAAVKTTKFLEGKVAAVATSVSEVSSSVELLHRRLLQAISGVKESFAVDVGSISNRLSETQKQVFETEEKVTALSQRLELFSSTFHDTEKFISELSCSLETQKKQHDTAFQNHTIEQISRFATMESMIEEKENFLLQRIVAAERTGKQEVSLQESVTSRLGVDVAQLRMNLSSEIEALKRFVVMDSSFASIAHWMSSIVDKELSSALSVVRDEAKALRQELWKEVESVGCRLAVETQTSTAAREALSSSLDVLRQSTDQLRIWRCEDTKKIVENIANIEQRFNFNVEASTHCQQQVEEVLSNHKLWIEEVKENAVRHGDTTSTKLLELESGFCNLKAKLKSIAADGSLQSSHLEELNEKFSTLEEQAKQSSSQISLFQAALIDVSRKIEGFEVNQKNHDSTVECLFDQQKAKMETLENASQCLTFAINANEEQLSKHTATVNQLSQIVDRATNTAADAHHAVEKVMKQSLASLETACLRHLETSPSVVTVEKAKSLLDPIEKVVDVLRLDTTQLKGEVSALISKVSTHAQPKTDSTATNYFSPLAHRFQETISAPVVSYTREEIDERFESHWNSVLLLLSRKEDHAHLEGMLEAVKIDIMNEVERLLENSRH